MPPKTEKRVLKDSTPSVLLGSARSRMAFRLDVREDASRAQPFFSQRKRPSAFARGRAKLFHYISAGGMKQLRRTSADELAEYRRRMFLTAVGVGALAWLFFYFFPST